MIKTIFILLISIFLITPILANNPKIPSQVVQISPTALDVLISSFDHLIIYFHRHSQTTKLDQSIGLLQQMRQSLNQSYPNDHILFGHLNLTNDHNNLLVRFADQTGFKIINWYHSIHLNQLELENGKFQEIYSDFAHPKLSLYYFSQVINDEQNENRYKLIFAFSQIPQITYFNQIFQKIHYFIQDYKIDTYLVPQQLHKKSSISLYYNQQLLHNYTFVNRTSQEAAQELIQNINIDTLPTVINIDDSNFHRVFGGSVNDQLLLIYNREDINHLEVDQIRQYFKKAAEVNQKQHLSNERVLFCEINTQTFQDNFNEDGQQILKNQNNETLKYRILFTKTDYDRFQLKRYSFKQQKQQPISEAILQFIEDVRMKKLDPEYKSQKIPTEQENNNILRKIVGKSFIPEVYEKPDQSIIILFIDSKDQESYRNAQQVLENVTVTYKQQFGDKLVTSIFDLAKNQHKLLYLKQAPQIVLFDKSNKKQTKYYRMEDGLTEEQLAKWIQREVTSIQIKLQEKIGEL